MISDRPQRNTSAVFIVWNRSRLHFYIGLYLLFFSWLFAFTGLLLNHPKWEFAQFWPNRVQSAMVQEFRPPAGNTEVERARDLMRQLGIVEEIQWPAARPPEGILAFQVSRPGHIREIKADLNTGHAAVQRTETNAWGIMHVLHTFTGTPVNDPSNRRDWTVTRVWALAMDAVGVGDRDRAQQLHHVVPVEGKAAVGHRSVVAGFRELRTVRGWTALADLAQRALIRAPSDVAGLSCGCRPKSDG
jgi:hypothetical protein